MIFPSNLPGLKALNLYSSFRIEFQGGCKDAQYGKTPYPCQTPSRIAHCISQVDIRNKWILEWLCELLNEWMNERMNERKNERLNGWMQRENTRKERKICTMSIVYFCLHLITQCMDPQTHNRGNIYQPECLNVPLGHALQFLARVPGCFSSDTKAPIGHFWHSVAT